MSDIYLVGVSDGGGSNSAVDFAANRAKASGASVTILHVLDWSPFSFLTPEELNERHKRREEELGRGQTAIVDPIVAKAQGGRDRCQGRREAWTSRGCHCLHGGTKSVRYRFT